MSTLAPYHPQYVNWPVDPALIPALDPYGVERSPSILRKLIELLLYVMVLNSVFLMRTGLVLIPYLSGGLNTASGLLCLFVMLLEGERPCMSVKFAVVMNVAANLSLSLGLGIQPVLGKGLPQMLHWFSMLTMICFLVQDRRAEKRLMLFFSVLLIGIMFFTSETISTRGGAERVGAAEDIGGNFANTNAVAYVGGFFCTALLFWSLRAARSFRPVLWFLSGLLLFITFRTVSRVGILLLLFGIGMLIIAIMMGRGTRVGGLILILVGMLVLSQLAFLFSDTMAALEKRIHGERESTMSRLNLYSWQTLGDLMETLFVGRGPANAQNTSSGITAHNTFVYTHMCYGGFAGWLFLAWTILLGRRLWRTIKARAYPWDRLIMLATFFALIVGEYMTNNLGFVDFSAMYGVAVIEKYTRPFSTRLMTERQWAASPHLVQPAYV